MSRCGRRGLTLIELVIGMSLAGILGIPTGLLLSETLEGLLNARDSVAAVSVAREAMERLESLNDFCHPDLAVNAPSGVTFDPYQGTPYTLTRTVWCQAGNCDNTCAAPANGANGIKRIEITVRKQGASPILISLVTYRTKFVSFGS